MSEDKVSRQESILESIRQARIQRIDFLGDSITQGCGFVSRQQGYPDFLLGKMKQLAGHDRFQTYNHAVGGATAADGAGRLHWCERTASPPDLSFVMFGLNDVYQSVSEEDYGESLGAIIRPAQAIGIGGGGPGADALSGPRAGRPLFQPAGLPGGPPRRCRLRGLLGPLLPGQPGSRGAALAGRNSPDRSGTPGSGRMDLEATSGDGEIIPGRSPGVPVSRECGVRN